MNIKDMTSAVRRFVIRRSFLFSIGFTFLFSVYNRIIGIMKMSLWHESISIYYLLLSVVKIVLYLTILKKPALKSNKKFHIIIKSTLYLSNLLVLLPVILMLTDRRSVDVSISFSIVIAIYVFFKTTSSIINFLKNKRGNIFVAEFKTIELMDSVISILTLQNTIILINGTYLDQTTYYVSLVVSTMGVLFNFYLVYRMKLEKFKLE